MNTHSATCRTCGAYVTGRALTDAERGRLTGIDPARTIHAPAHECATHTGLVRTDAEPVALAPTAIVEWSAPGFPRRQTRVALWHSRRAGNSDEAGARRILAIRFLPGGLDAAGTITLHSLTVTDAEVTA